MCRIPDARDRAGFLDAVEAMPLVQQPQASPVWHTKNFQTADNIQFNLDHHTLWFACNM